MTGRRVIPAFSGYGIELEYMIVDRTSLAVRPIAHRLLPALRACEAARTTATPLDWSNELVAHVVETKNVAPAPTVESLPHAFADALCEANKLLATMDACLMPTAMHPWMDPATETVLWDDATDIYRTYDRIYGCRGHGWANLQSMHVNLPFADDSQFARLHAATRLVLPLLPALAASSPIVEGLVTRFLDFRLDAYYGICALTPRVAGDVIPETVESRAEYEARILTPMYDEIAPHDPAGVLRHEWLNSRGAIPRFDRDALEIRLIDVQECPLADLSIAAAVVTVIHWLYAERSAPLADQQALETSLLARVLRTTIREADEAIVDNVAYLRALGIGATRCSAGDAWRALLDAAAHDAPLARAWWRPALDVILAQGPLARRIVRATGRHPSRQKLHAVYATLCDCLRDGRMFA
jgi:gamma-glutamyl:cysteine ligase YbdK (ATP-grasp superfamily)